MTELLTPAEVAERLKITTTQVLNYLSTGKLKGIRISPRVVRIRTEDLEAILLPYTDSIEAHLTVTAILNAAGDDAPDKALLNETAAWLRERGNREVKRSGIRGFIVDDGTITELKGRVNADT